MAGNIPRNPPQDVRQALAEEVGFGCPVEDCGSPYLSWHHFAPPWRERHHNDPAGMIALCLHHHKMADGNSFTDDQLFKLKASPFLRNRGIQPKGLFQWRRENLVIFSGSNWYVGCPTILKVHGQQLIWLTRDNQENLRLNLDLRTQQGQEVLQMRENGWQLSTAPSHFACPPGGASLELRHLESTLRVSIRFQQHTRASLAQFAEKMAKKAHKALLGKMPPNLRELVTPPVGPPAGLLEAVKGESLAVCTISGHFLWPVQIDLTPSMTSIPQAAIVSSVMVNGETAISIE